MSLTSNTKFYLIPRVVQLPSLSQMCTLFKKSNTHHTKHVVIPIMLKVVFLCFLIEMILTLIFGKVSPDACT